MSPSSLTWLQFDAEQSRRAHELVRVLSEPTTQDSIGIGSIRDGLANLLFPGTSTNQTRVRYFLLVPWALQHVARSNPRTREHYNRRLREVEVATIEALRQGSPSARGVIGVEKGSALRQLPSDVYWTGTAAWGIRLAENLSQSDLGDHARLRPETRRRDDGTAEPFLIWDDLPQPPKGFPHTPLSVVPNPEEADYLLGKMVGTCESTSAPGSATSEEPTVLALIARRPECASATFPWEVEPSVLTQHAQDLVHLARDFSLVIHGARLRYLELLFERKEQATGHAPPNRDALDALLAEWLGQMAAAEGQISDWPGRLPELFNVLVNHGTNLRTSTRTFVELWSAAAVRDPGVAMRDAGLATLIRDREAALKRSSARLTYDSPLHSWNGELLGSDRLDFRWHVTRRHILDCVEGRERVDAEPS